MAIQGTLPTDTCPFPTPPPPCYHGLGKHWRSRWALVLASVGMWQNAAKCGRNKPSFIAIASISTLSESIDRIGQNRTNRGHSTEKGGNLADKKDKVPHPPTLKCPEMSAFVRLFSVLPAPGRVPAAGGVARHGFLDNKIGPLLPSPVLLDGSSRLSLTPSPDPGAAQPPWTSCLNRGRKRRPLEMELPDLCLL